MSDILIITIVKDLHAAAVEWCLSKKNYTSITWLVTDFPDVQTINYDINALEESISIRGPNLSLKSTNLKSIWFRRMPRELYSENIHPDDKKLAIRETNTFLMGVVGLLSRKVTCVNHPNASLFARNKLIQMVIAKECGLTIPASSIGNDPKLISHFIERFDSKAIHKTFSAMVWNTENGKNIAFTTKVSLRDTSDTESVKICPSIYQEFIPKKYEIRATIFGATCLAGRLDTQSIEGLEVDWRIAIDQKIKVPLEPITLPQGVIDSCRKLMKELGLLFGSFDLIQTEDDEFIFIEVNEMGQFLWVEAACPEIPLLQAFSEFLANPSENFIWSGNTDKALSYESYLNSDACQDFLAGKYDKHKSYNSSTPVSENSNATTE